MGRRKAGLALNSSLIALGVAVTFVAGCGGDTKVVVVTKTVDKQDSPPAKVAAEHPRAHTRSMKSCDPNIRAKVGTTSCAFAENVFYEYWNALQAGDDAVVAYSPVTGTEYHVACNARTRVVCRSGDRSVVTFSKAAVDAYDVGQAERYACSHDVSAGGRDCSANDKPPSPDSGGSSSGSDRDSKCDPSYEGACLDPSSADYDCAGGSGDGPDYTGAVTVVGDDHFGLDRDGDGYACE